MNKFILFACSPKHSLLQGGKTVFSKVNSILFAGLNRFKWHYFQTRNHDTVTRTGNDLQVSRPCEKGGGRPQDRQVLPGPLAPHVSSGGHSSPTGAWLENRGGSPAVPSFLFFSPTTCIPFKCIFIKIMVSELFNRLTNLYFSTGKRKSDVLKIQ